MDTFSQDINYALRGFKKSPGFMAAAVFALAVGIGANTAIFSVMDAVLLHPLAFKHLRNPDRLVMIWEKNPTLTLFFANRMPPRVRNFRAWKEQAHSFSDMTVWNDTSLTLTSARDSAGAKPEQVESAFVDPNFFPMLGIRTQLGRGFKADEGQPGKDRVAIIGNELWRSRFNHDPHILGKTVIANRKEYQIVGVLPPAFELPAIWGGSDQKKAQLWLPMNLYPGKDAEEGFNTQVFARLKPGVTVAQARQEMDVIAARLARAVPDKNVGFGVNVTTLAEEDVGPELRQALYVLQIAVAFVLLIACANVGNLLLTRAIARDKEIAIRTALGASRFRIVRQMITESLLLSTCGAVIGVFLAFWALRILSALAPPDTHGFHELRIDSPVLAFTVGVAIVTGLLFGLAPASFAWKERINETLNRSSRSVAATSGRLRNALVTIEVALAVVLLAGAGLMIRTLSTLTSTDLGFERDHLFIAHITLPSVKYEKPADVAAFNDRLLESVRNLPGVRNATLTTALPMKSVSESSFEIPGRHMKPGQMPVSDWARTSDGYFETLRMRVLKGRTYTRQEALSDNPGVAVVNSGFARTFWPGEDPLGKAFVFGNDEGKNTTYHVIGVVPDEHQLGPDNPRHTEFYLPSHHLSGIYLVARTVGDPLLMAAAIKQQVWNIDKDQPVSEVGTEEDALREWETPRRFNMTVLLNFAGVALLLAAVGLYSVLAYSVTLRTREIGIRIALGADPRKVARFVLGQGFRMALAGVVIGIAGAFALTRFMQSLIFGVSATDPITFVLTPLLLIAISLAASYAPARRASRVDPVEALRQE